MAFVLAPEALAQVLLVRGFLRWAASRRNWWMYKCVAVAAILLLVAGTASNLDYFDSVFDYFPNGVIGKLQTGVSLWGFCSTIAVIGYLLIHVPLERASRGASPARRAFLRVVSGMTLAAPIAATAAGALIERTNLETTELQISLPRLPEGLEGLRLVQISDIHLSPYLDVATLERVVRLANELRPDIVFVTGDLITSAYDPVDECLLRLAGLRARCGVFGCMGNHENYAGVEDHVKVQGGRLGLQFLRSERKTLSIGGDALHISGVDYEPFERRSHYLDGAEKLIAEGGVNILMSHNPDVFPRAAELGFDLTLAGHTHGGQVTVEILPRILNPARILTPYVRGLYRQGEKYCYVNRGIGTLGIPVRIGCRPEITLIRLTRA